MQDKNDLSTQRRNLMLMNVLMFLLAITDKKITEFKILNIQFDLNKELLFIESFNDLLIIIWIYFLIRYTSSMFYKIRYEAKLNSNNENFYNFKTSKLHVNISNYLIQSLLKFIFGKDSLDVFPIFLAFITSLMIYSHFIIYLVLITAYTVLFIMYYNSKIIKKEKIIKNIENKKQRDIYKLKKEKFLNKRIKD